MNKNKSEPTQPINVSVNLKNFLINRKEFFRLENNEFYSIPSTLMYYLNNSEKFIKDYDTYCKEKGIKNELTNKERVNKINGVIKYAKDKLI